MPPTDTLQDIRNEMILEMERAGIHQDKVVLVTGGASGIGRAAALAFAREGAAVTIADLDTDRGSDVEKEIRQAGGRALFIETDVTSEAQVHKMVTRTVEEFGGLDSAFNNAGSPGEYCTALTCNEAVWNRIIRINMTAVWLCMKYEIPEMLKRGGGAIVNTASRAADSAAQNLFAYVATKHAVLGMTRSTALDFAEQNIRVNAILPGAIETPMLQTAVEGIGFSFEEMAQPIPMKRIGKASEAAEAAVWLCSDRASYMTGNAIVVDGGQHASIY